MSLILKGIDMPKNDQVIVIHSDGTFNEVDPFAKVLMPLYEAIQILAPHGRLIDEDDLISELTELQDLNLESIAPTILEAEE